MISDYKLMILDLRSRIEHLPNNRVVWTFTDQIVRSSTSVLLQIIEQEEANELVSIFVASVKTVKKRLNYKS